jgi:DNA-binding NtrC family response regulator
VLTSQNSKRNILAVDDDPDITFTIKIGLEDSGLFQVDIFNDPELALSKPVEIKDLVRRINAELEQL